MQTKPACQTKYPTAFVYELSFLGSNNAGVNFHFHIFKADKINYQLITELCVNDFSLPPSKISGLWRNSKLFEITTVTLDFYVASIYMASYVKARKIQNIGDDIYVVGYIIHRLVKIPISLLPKSFPLTPTPPIQANTLPKRQSMIFDIYISSA